MSTSESKNELFYITFNANGEAVMTVKVNAKDYESAFKKACVVYVENCVETSSTQSREDLEDTSCPIFNEYGEELEARDFEYEDED